MRAIFHSLEESPMPVITTDALIEGIRRDDVLEWLGKPENHQAFLERGFSKVEYKGNGHYQLGLRVGPRLLQLGYQFDRVDDSHGGRRVLCNTTGKRTQGVLNYSLRTSKPSRNTMITLRKDYKAGRLLGPLLDAAGIGKALEAAWQASLSGLVEVIQSDIGNS